MNVLHRHGSSNITIFSEMLIDNITLWRQLACRYRTNSDSWRVTIEPTVTVGMPLSNKQWQLACHY
jgi:hypothetical protein